MKLHIPPFFLLATLLLPPTLLSAAPTSGCLTGGCHQELTRMKHMHGPIGAELAGVKACVMCHIPSGPACSATKGGAFTHREKDMCLTCHDKGTSSQHANAAGNCLLCHNPHGSNISPYMLRDKT